MVNLILSHSAPFVNILDLKGHNAMFDKMQSEILNAEIPEELDLDFSEIMCIHDMGKDPFSLITHAFTYGLMKGGCLVHE